MMTENEIKNQYRIAQEIKKQEGWTDELDRYALYGYIHALGWVLGIITMAKYNKEDI